MTLEIIAMDLRSGYQENIVLFLHEKNMLWVLISSTSFFLFCFVLRFYGPVNPMVVSLPNHKFTGQA